MKRCFLTIWMFICCAMLSYGQTTMSDQEGDQWINTQYNTTEGTEFWVTFMRNYGSSSGDNNDMYLYLYATSRENATVTITNTQGASMSFNVEAGKQDSCMIPNSWAYIERDREVGNFGLQVTSDKPISLYATNQHSSWKYDATNVLPAKSLVGEYVVQTYRIDNASTEFAIVATTNQNVTIRIKKTTINLTDFELNHKVTVESIDTSEVITLQMTAGQTYLYRSATTTGNDNANRATSLSGTAICSEQPLALFIGGQSVSISADPENHIFHQAYSTDQWGKTFVVTPTYGMIYDFIQITAAENNTVIRRNGTPIATIQAKETYLDTIQSLIEYISPVQSDYTPNVVVYTTSKAAECYLYGTGYAINHPFYNGAELTNTSTDYGAPILTPIIPQEWAMKSTIFATFTKSNAQLKHYVNIVTPTDQKGGMRLDGQDISSDFTPIAGTNYSYAMKEVSSQAHTIENVGDHINSTFTARVYGLGNFYSKRESYAYAAGSRIERSADILLNDQYVDSISMCDNDAVNLEGVIRYDYTDIDWLLVDSGVIKGEREGDTIFMEYNDTKQVNGVEFPHITDNLPHDWTVNMFVTRTTPLQDCEHNIIDTVTATIRVLPTSINDTTWEETGKPKKFCYGDTIAIDYSPDGDKEHVTMHRFVADTITPAEINKGPYGTVVFELDSVYTIVDSLKNIYNCDSVVTKSFIIHPTYDTIVYDTTCYKALPYEWRNEDDGSLIKMITKEQMVNKHNLHLTQEHLFLTDSILDSTVLQTIHGCDSVIHMRLLVMPDYELHDTAIVCRDSVTMYYNGWEGHVKENGYALPNHHLQVLKGTKWTYAMQIDIAKVGEFVYRDSMKTTFRRCKSCDEIGCDSIWYLHMTVLDHYKTVTDSFVCDDHFVDWEDTLRIGKNCPEPTNGRPWIRYDKSNVTIEVQHQTDIYGECDSTFVLRLHFCPTYKADTTYTHICENESYRYQPRYPAAHPHDKTYQWTCDVNANGSKQVGRYVFTDTVKTILSCRDENEGCDSIVAHVVYVHPTYAFEMTDTVCQNADYQWAGHSAIAIETSEPGLHTYVDSLRTKTCTDCRNGVGCDSVWTLHLYVHPTLYEEVNLQLCPEQLPYTYCENGATIPVGYSGGTITDTIPSRQFAPYLCDSVITYHITIADENIIPTVAQICENNLPYHFTYPPMPQGAIHSYLFTDFAAPGLYYDTVAIEGQCRTIYTLDLKVNPIYDHTLTPRSVCENEMPYQWQLSDAQNGTKTITIPLPDGAVLPYDTLCTQVLQSTSGCDSIVRLPLTVYPTYEDPVIYDTICESALPYDYADSRAVRLQGLTQTGVYTDTIASVHGCDSIVHLQLQVLPTTVYEHDVLWCYSAGPYSYGEHGQSTIVPGTYIDTLITKNQYGCDSVEILHLQILETIIDAQYDTICDNEYFDHPDTRATRLQHLNQNGIYYDTLLSISGCDSIIELHLQVWSTYEHEQHEAICDNESFDFHGHVFEHLSAQDTPYTFDSVLTSIHGCDSLIHFSLMVYPTYEDPVIYDTICETEVDWSWHISDTYGTYTVDVPVRDLQQQLLDTTLTYTLHTATSTMCDSVVHLHRTVKPILRDTIYPVMCPENLPYRSNPNGKAVFETSVYNDTLTGIIYGCDSVLTVHLTVLDKLITPIYIDTCDNEVPYNHPTENNHLMGLTTSGIYYDTLQSHLSGCDSIIELHLQVWSTYEHEQHEAICDNESFDFHGHVFEHLAAKDTPYTFDSVLTSIHGCDSLIHFSLMVYPTYAFLQDTLVCQDTIHTEWTWTDEFGGKHDNIHISIAEAGDYVYADTLPTIHGCDSVFGIRIHVAPIYRFDSTYVICQDERIEWQGKAYSGDMYGWGYERLEGDRYDTHRDSVYYHYEPGDSILTPGVYYDTAHYFTAEGCDSIFYLRLEVYPAGHYIRDEVACDNEAYHVFYTSDIYGEHTDTIFFNRSTRMIDATRRDTLYFEAERRLTTANGKCDSTIHFHLTVHPAYEYVTKAQICWDGAYEWRGGTYVGTGVYYDSIPGGTDYWGCDSVYVLELYRKPVNLVPIYDTICDDVTYEHVDTLWYTNGTQSTVQTLVWKPGMTIPQSYTDVVFKGIDGCDSIIYRYYLQINPTYQIYDTAVICSNEVYEADNHVYTGYENEYDTDVFILPFDTAIIDRYQSVHLCDSVFNLQATIYPTYRHRDTITICDDEQAQWRAHSYQGSMYGDGLGNGYTAGEHIFRDSLQTVNQCDSIYELHLFVTPTYLIEEQQTKCADDDLTWHSINLDHLAPGEHFFYDSLTTTGFGCDSVYHLYLTVIDTTFEIRHDTICRTEIYDFHGVELTESGYYHDTTLNEWGCRHFTYLYLEVIEPTVPTAWVDSICADDQAYDLFYSYTGEYDPIAYSLYYDEDGHANGFEDIVDEPITSPEQLYWLTIPMPNVNEDRTNYPRPDYYNIRLVLDNGICTNPDLCSTDTSLVLSYPSWITRQRFGDVIALYNDRYNGGYHWAAYQWYHGDTLLVGETHEYLYVPTGLIVGDQYHVRLTRTGELQDFQTCPITIIADPIVNDFAPSMSYLSVVPTCVCAGNPYIYILSRKDGHYRITGSRGALVSEGIFRADVTKVEVPALIEGVYIVQLWSNDTPEEPYRCIKIIVNQSCPNYDMPF